MFSGRVLAIDCSNAIIFCILFVIVTQSALEYLVLDFKQKCVWVVRTGFCKYYEPIKICKNDVTNLIFTFRQPQTVVEQNLYQRSGVASPKVLGGPKFLILGVHRVFGLGYHLSKHTMTTYGPLDPLATTMCQGG